jgi:hypothetical protein
MRSYRVIRASDLYQCKYCNNPGFDPSILRVHKYRTKLTAHTATAHTEKIYLALIVMVYIFYKFTERLTTGGVHTQKHVLLRKFSNVQ